MARPRNEETTRSRPRDATFDRKALVYRSPRTHDELVELFRLRHRNYRNTLLAELAPDAGDGYAVDRWDPFSFHFGLYVSDEIDAEPIGYHRLVPSLEDIRRGYRPAGVLDASAWLPTDALPETELPFLTFWPDPAKGRATVRALARCNPAAVEATRLNVVEGRRSMPALLGLLTGTCTVLARVLGVATAVTAVAVDHASAYARLGFVELDRGPTPVGDTVLLEAAAARMPDRLMRDAAGLADEFRREGTIHPFGTRSRACGGFRRSA